jgi:hypothetical protein
LGNIFCGIAAFYAVLAYYASPCLQSGVGESSPVPGFGHAALVIMALFGFGLALLLPSWIALYRLNKGPKREKIGSQSAPEPQPQAANPIRTEFQNIEDFYKTYDNRLLAEAEQVFRNAVSQYRPEDHEKMLIRICSTIFWIGVFELDYAVSFGSQLRALQVLNTESDGLKVDALKAYFDEGLLTVPEKFRDRSFDMWLGWLRDMVLVLQQLDKVKITVRGHEFLKYIIARRYTFERLG